MTYNLHPIFVHFPIALLFIYSIIKVLPFDKWFPKVSWKHIEMTLLTLGVLSAFVAASTGETAERLEQPDRQLVEAHATFASITIWLYGLLLVGEFLKFFNPKIALKLNIPWLNDLLLFIEKVLTHRVFSKVLAFLGFVAIFVTGLLGGAMVYGTSADPLAPFVLKLLGISI